MLSHHRWEDASRRRERALRRAVATTVALAMLGIATLSGIAPLRADGRSATSRNAVDTEHLFGSTEGSDIGAAGEKEIESDSTFRFSKQTGSFANVASELEFKYTAFRSFRISAVATFAYYDIAGVTGMEDRRGGLRSRYLSTRVFGSSIATARRSA
jgi:hypothetical protein